MNRPSRIPFFRQLAMWLPALLLLSGCNAFRRTSAPTAAEEYYLLVGSYATPQDEGIKVYAFDSGSGACRYVSGLRGLSNPSYLTVSRDGMRVYAVGEESDSTSCAHTLSFDAATGRLTPVNTQPTHGAAPCHIALSPQEEYALTANYLGANITLFPLDAQGRLQPGSTIDFTGCGPDPERQEQPHLHCITFTPDSRLLLANDLGTDRIHCFPLCGQQSDGAHPLLDPSEAFDVVLPAGTGPRHLDFAPDGRHAYLLGELSGEVHVLAYDAGKLTLIQTLLADSLQARGSADIHVSPDGRHLYASNRLRDDGLAIFRIDSVDGTLAKVGYCPTGPHPRNFVITPDGRFLLVACRDSNEIRLLARDSLSGLLTDTGKRIETLRPVCLKFVRRQK